jgi:hypothetical protein
MWFITCDSKAAPYSELDQAKCRVIWISPARSLQDHDRLLDTTLKADMVIGARGGHEDSSLGDEDDGSYREVVKHEPRPTHAIAIGLREGCVLSSGNVNADHTFAA